MLTQKGVSVWFETISSICGKTSAHGRILDLDITVIVHPGIFKIAVYSVHFLCYPVSSCGALTTCSFRWVNGKQL